MISDCALLLFQRSVYEICLPSFIEFDSIGTLGAIIERGLFFSAAALILAQALNRTLQIL